MNDGFKQRLVGAIVLICGALILWPVLFSDTTAPVVDQHTQIPPMPEFKKYEVPEPSRPENVIPVADAPVEQEPPVDQAPVSDRAPAQQGRASSADKKAVKAPPKASSTPVLDKHGLPQGWSLQVASFSQAGNADELKAKLLKLGYKAYTRTVVTKGGDVVRVYVGPKLSKRAFERDRLAIDKKFGVKSIVVKFEQ